MPRVSRSPQGIGRINRRYPDHDPHRETNRRSFFVGSIAFLGGILSGATTTYIGDYLGVIAPPEEQGDAQSRFRRSGGFRLMSSG